MNVGETRGRTVEGRSQTAYRVPADRPPAPEEPFGEPLRPTPEDERSLGRSRTHERNRLVGMIIAALVLLRCGAAVAGGTRAVIGMSAGGIVLLLYAAWSWAHPRIAVHSVIRIDPQSDPELGVSLGEKYSLNVVLQPTEALSLSPLRVRVIAERGRESRRVAYATEHILASGQEIGPGQAARYAVDLELPEGAPCTSRKRAVEWRIEVSVGAPQTFARVEPIVVRPPLA